MARGEGTQRTIIKRRPKIHPWERQEDEPRDEYEAFCAYRDLDPADRSIRAAYFKYKGTEPETTDHNAPGGWYDRAHEWRWKERALAFDREQERKIMAKLQQRRLKSLVEMADLGETLRKKAGTAARLLSATSQMVGTHDGREVMILASNLTADQIAKLAEVGVKIEQLALGNPTERQALVGDPESPIGITVETAKEALRRRVDEIRKRREEATADAE